MQRMMRVGMWVGVAVLGLAGSALAGGLGINLDAFLAQVETFIVGLGVILFLAAGAGVFVATTENQYAPYLSHYLGFFIKGGIYAGLGAIAAGLGLVHGAVLLGAW